MTKALFLGLPIAFALVGAGWLIPHATPRHASAEAPRTPRDERTEPGSASRSRPETIQAFGPPSRPLVVATKETEDAKAQPAPEPSEEAPPLADDSLWVDGVAVSRQELSFKLESKFQDDGPADRAGRELERSIAEQFTGHEALTATLNKAECRDRLCRIELSASDKYAASRAFEGLYRGALVTAGGALAPAYEATPDGRVRLVIYVAKQGSLDLS